ncbi:catechol 2,3-dioxygenase-like lactoylglutathione lyase family enzyme [Nonomuraea polychroma]|uniref:Bleomycin resistance protein n=1 Tax=Nonomuraea polychroma TaxID=46176 RepID=A0A438M4Y9_9ACTN|nr:glyoxalase superfamily protein [Nonomuraea polychroma]RVX40812.1 catechol 2,3-dioxygenase-like lactoylglutathione lyase family enzyme [Nonomuraea polychroma]
MRTFRDAKAMAKTLRAELLDRCQVELSHSACLEIVARQFGLDNYNILAAKLEESGPGEQPRAGSVWRTPFSETTTIPVLRVFSEEAAKDFYVDFLGFTLDFGGPARGPGTPFYGQVSRPGTTLQLSEHAYQAGPGATVDIWLAGLDGLWEELSAYVQERNLRIWGPGIWVPDIMKVEWDARVLILADPFGNHLRLSEPDDPASHAVLPRWTFSRDAG